MTMTRRQYHGALAVLVVSGLLGGVRSNWLLPGRTAWAQGEGAANEVRAERFVLVDEAGEVRAALGLGADVGPCLLLCDAAGEGRASLGLSADGSPSVGLLDPAGEVRAALGLSADGAPSLFLCDEAGEARVTLAVVPGGAPTLELADAAGQCRATVMVLDDGGPSVTLWDAAGKLRAVLGSTGMVILASEDTGAEHKYPESTLTLFNAAGKVIWQAP